jgi:allantoinase
MPTKTTKKAARKPAKVQPKPFHDRIAYSPIVERPRLKLPGGARVAVWTIVNAEEWAVERPMPRTVLPPPYGQPLLPDLPNWAWHEYGMRVGFWRFLEALERFKLKATFAVNGSVIESYKPVAKAALDAGWEFMGHGYVQRPMHHLDD